VLASVARRARADVVVCHNFTPAFGPAVTFVHDVLFQTNPEWFTAAERLYLGAIPRLSRRAAVIATSSQHEADRIRRLNPAVRQVEAVGLAISTELAGARQRRPAGLPDVASFALTVSRLNVRKNLDRLINAAAAPGVSTPDCPLVVVGEPEGRTAALSAAARAAVDRGAVLFLDRVDDETLAWLYAHAAVFCYLSLDEGFGLPPLEALHFGAPLLVSDIPVFRETCGDRGRYVDPYDERAIAAALRDMLADTGVRRAPTRREDDWRGPTTRLRELALQVARERGRRDAPALQAAGSVR
jgi:glycosyltransferase involved in cell wall biosynthesis